MGTLIMDINNKKYVGFLAVPPSITAFFAGRNYLESWRSFPQLGKQLILQSSKYLSIALLYQGIFGSEYWCDS